MSSNYMGNSKDDGPITSICVIENALKCPPGFIAITKTYGDNSDADLWKEIWFFNKISRYLCTSKSESIADYIVEDIVIINEKDSLPVGYSMIPKTIDTDQKAWRKKQLCYKLRRKDICRTGVKDIILISKNRSVPSGYKLLGDINGLFVCYQVGPLPTIAQNQQPKSPLSNLYPSASISDSNVAGLLNGSMTDANHNYENVYNKSNISPPPLPSRSAISSSSPYQGLQGLPFILNPRLQELPEILLKPVVSRKYRTREQIEEEYKFDFPIEKYLP